MPNSLPLVTKSSITFYSQNRTAILKQPIESLVEASYSTVLTLANFILFYSPSLVPPNFPEPVLEGNTIDSEFPQMYLTYNRLFEPWCDYLSELIMQKKADQVDDICHIHDNVSDEFIAKLNLKVFNIQEIEQNQQSQASAETKSDSENTIGQQQKTSKNNKTKSKKIAIINFALSQLRTDFLKPKMHLIGLFTGIFFNQGDQWSVYNILKGHYPTKEDYQQIDTIILSGSSLSVNDDVSEIADFVETLKQAVKLNPKLKILGICFGHQTLAKMFGGKIVQKKLKAGVQKINFDQDLIENTPYFMRSQLGGSIFELSQYHKDFVVEIPKDFSIFAQSQSCQIESLISKDKKYLSFQFHPQYSAEYIRSFQMRLQHYQIFDLKSAYSHIQRGSIKHDSSLWQIRKIIRNFIDWQAPSELPVIGDF